MASDILVVDDEATIRDAREEPAFERDFEGPNWLDRRRESGYPAQVVASHLVTPREWEQAGLPAGTPFSASHRFTQTGPFRTRNRSARRPGLFYAGAGTTPGVGVPMVLLSGGLAAQRVQTYLRREQQ